jgi:hypothetical protein
MILILGSYAGGVQICFGEEWRLGHSDAFHLLLLVADMCCPHGHLLRGVGPGDLAYQNLLRCLSCPCCIPT